MSPYPPITTTSQTGYTCWQCGGWVPNGCIHYCPTFVQPRVTVTPLPAPAPDWQWKDGYQTGFKDGFEAGREAATPTEETA